MEYNNNSNNFNNNVSPSQNFNQVPPEIKKWNWGAFSFNIYWGIGNRTYLPLLCLIPYFNIIWVFVCGIKGNEWAWKDGNYTDIDEFNSVQATWSRAGLFSFIIGIIFTFIAIFVGILFISVLAMAFGSMY